MHKKSTPTTKNRWKKTVGYLPENLTIKLKELKETNFFFDKKEYWRCVKLFCRIVNKLDELDRPLDYELPLPQAYIKEVISTDGLSMWSRILKETDLLIQVTNHSTTNHQCRKYRINSPYCEGSPTRINYESVPKRLSPFEKQVLVLLKRTTLELPEGESVESMVEKQRGFFIKGIKRRINLKTKKYKPEKGKAYYIKGNIEDFIRIKTERRIFKEKFTLNKIMWSKFRARVNTTNGRLDTNYTNLNSLYRKYLRIDGKPISSIDLSNSQFCLFANILQIIIHNNHYILNKLYKSNIILGEFVCWCKMYTMKEKKRIDSSDIERFCKSSFKGTLYEDLVNVLEIKGQTKEDKRNRAKKMAFQLFFGSPFFKDSDRKKKLSEHYPKVVALIDGFKKHLAKLEEFKYQANPREWKKLNGNKTIKKVGSNKFPIMLQQIESFIFIESIYKPMLEAGEPIISIHDSFHFPSDYDFPKSKFDAFLPYGKTFKNE